jgi:hypothetical protein
MRTFITDHLNPVDALVQLMYGVLIIMSFTMAVHEFGMPMSAGGAAGTSMTTLYMAALGSALTWGIIDAVMYVLGCVGDRNQRIRILREVQEETNVEERVAWLEENFDEELATLAPGEDRRPFYLAALPRIMSREHEETGVTVEDLKGGLAILMVALIALLPVIVPLLFIRDYEWSMRVANLLCLTMLYVAGYLWGRMTGGRPHRSAWSITALGILLVVIAMSGY